MHNFIRSSLVEGGTSYISVAWKINLIYIEISCLLNMHRNYIAHSFSIPTFDWDCKSHVPFKAIYRPSTSGYNNRKLSTVCRHIWTFVKLSFNAVNHYNMLQQFNSCLLQQYDHITAMIQYYNIYFCINDLWLIVLNVFMRALRGGLIVNYVRT